MKICIFGASFLPRRGGMEYVIHNLSQALIALGHEVTVIAERTAWAGIGVDHEYGLARYGVPTRGLRSSGIAEIESLYRIGQQHKKTGFDIMHCHSVSYAGTRAIRAKNRYGIPVVMTPHGEDVQRVPEIGYGLRLDSGWNTRIEANLNAADAVTAISRSVQNELDCMPANRVVRIPNGVHRAQFGAGDSRFLRERLGLDSDTIILLSVGRNHVKKGYDYGIKAVADLRDRLGIHNVHYAVIGKLTTQHKELVASLNIGDQVSLIEELAPSDIIECYRSADIFFSPSIIEGLSLVSIEAISCGLPVVVTNVPGNADIVDDTNAGLIVESENPSSMADGLAKLVSNHQQRAALAEVALRESERYDWKSVAEQYLELYQLVVEGRSPDLFASHAGQK